MTPRAQKTRGGARTGAGRPRSAEADGAILEACLGLLEKHGYGGLSVDDVAAAAGVAKTTLYRRWPSKPALVAAAARPLYHMDLEPPDSGSVREDLLLLLQRSRELMRGRTGRLLTMLLRESAEHDELREPVQAAIYGRRRLYNQVLNRAIARGELRADLDQDLTIDLLLGPFWVRTVVTPSVMPPESVPAIVEALLSGILRR
jgi:AcrR family transcriptional regulator